MYSCQLGFCLPPNLKAYLEQFCYGIPHMHWHSSDQLALIIRQFNLHSDEALDQLSRQLEALAYIKHPVHFHLKSLTPFRSRRLYKLALSIEFLDTVSLKDWDYLLIQAKCQLLLQIEPHIELSTFSPLHPDRLVAYLENHSRLSPNTWVSDTLYLSGRHQKASNSFYREVFLRAQ